MLDGAKWLNQRGGIFGRKLEILLIEDTSQTAETMAAYRKLNEADHIPLLYLYSTETAVSLSPHIHFDRIPTLVSSLPSGLADPSRYPYLFTITPTSLDLLRIGIKFISENSGLKARKPRIIFVGSRKDAGLPLWDEIKSYAKASGLDVGPDTWVPEILPSTEIGESDSPGKKPLPLLSVMDAYDPDFACLSLTPKEAVFVLKEAQKMGLKTKWVCSRKAFDENLSGFDRDLRGPAHPSFRRGCPRNGRR